MKTNIFSLQRIGLLFQRYFIERFRSELIYWGIMAIVFMFLRNNFPAMCGLILVAGAFYVSHFLREIHHSSNGVAYFMIPATQLEKLTVAFIMTTFYYFFMMIIAYVIGNLTGTFLNNMLAGFFHDGLINNSPFFHHSPLQWILFVRKGGYGTPMFFGMFGNINLPTMFYIFRTFLFIQSLFLFGGIYFKKNQTLKTFAATILIFLILGIFTIIVIKLILGNILPLDENPELWHRLMAMFQIIYILLIPFFWIVSYFRLTEKQV